MKNTTSIKPPSPLISAPKTVNKHIHSSNLFTHSISDIQNSKELFWHKFTSLISKITFSLNRNAEKTFINKYFKLPFSYKKTISHNKNETSITLTKEYEKYIPSHSDLNTSEDLQDKNSVAELTDISYLSCQFNKDFPRIKVYLHTPYREENKEEIKDPQFLAAKFGRENAIFISQIAHQGLLNEAGIEFSSLNKKEIFLYVIIALLTLILLKHRKVIVLLQQKQK